jgi:uncharacterized protein (DUF983 family)
VKLTTVIGRGLRQRCPQCGRGTLFEGWGVLRERCLECGCLIQAREDDCWFFMYMTTAAVTGVFILAMFALTPRNVLWGKLVSACLALFVFLKTQPIRKGLAIAIEYWVDHRLEFPRHGS